MKGICQLKDICDTAKPRQEQRIRLRSKMMGYLKRLRERAIRENPHNTNQERLREIVFCDLRKGYLDGQYVDRLVLFLRGSGCNLVSKTGGCTFCGFWDVTNFGNKIKDEDYMSQVKTVIDNESYGFSKCPIICMYNDGSMLEEVEISLKVVEDLCRMVAERDHVKRIVIEAKVVDITEQKAAKLRAAVGDKEFEIAVGFESANELVRDHCINKSFRLEQFEKKHEILLKHNIALIPLVMVKPPFLTESQAIDDVVNTFAYLERFNLQRIDLELATIEKNTLVHELWECGEYKTPRLWSIIEIVKRKTALGLKTPIFLSPPNYTATAYEYSLNCPACSDRVVEAIKAYNREQDAAVFDSLECSCEQEWRESMEVKNAGTDLLDNIENLLDKLIVLKEPLAGKGTI